MRSFIADGIAAQLARGADAGGGVRLRRRRARRAQGASTENPDDLVFNPLNPRAARDNFLQGAVDILQALRVCGGLAAAARRRPGRRSRSTRRKLTFFGHSQGSTSGELAMALSDAAPAAILLGRGVLPDRVAARQDHPGQHLGRMTFLIGEALDAEHPVMAIFQTYFDRSTPSATTRSSSSARPGRRVEARLHVVGHDDTYTPRSTLEATRARSGWRPWARCSRMVTPAITAR